MDDVLHKALKWVDYNRWLVVMILLLGATGVWLAGCDIKTTFRGQKVTARELPGVVVQERKTLAVQESELLQAQFAYNAEVTAFNDSLAAAEADIEEQAWMRMAVLDLFTETVTAALSGQVFGVGQLVGALAIITPIVFGVGYRGQAKRTVGVLEEKKAENALLKAENTTLNDRITELKKTATAVP